MCTNIEAFKREVVSIIRQDPSRISEMCTVFQGVDTPEKLAEYVEIPQEEMTRLLHS